MSDRTLLMVDPGAVSGVGIAFLNHLHDIELHTWEIPDGAVGLSRWLTEEGPAFIDAMIIEDFVIDANTWKKTQEGAVTPAWQGVGIALHHGMSAGLELGRNLILVGASEHKTFSGVKKPLKDPDNKVRALDLAPVTPDRHEMDAGSLLLQLLDRQFPKALAKLVGPLLRDPE